MADQRGAGEFHCEHCCTEMTWDELVAHLDSLRGQGTRKVEIHVR